MKMQKHIKIVELEKKSTDYDGNGFVLYDEFTYILSSQFVARLHVFVPEK